MQTVTNTEVILNHRQIVADELDIHVIECGRSTGSDFLLLHGWPEDWSIYEQVLRLLGKNTRAAAIDLPGIGGSKTQPASGNKRLLARQVMAIARELDLRGLTLVGHDVGGQIVYACLHCFADQLQRAVMMNIVVPGVYPWNSVIRNPQVWHFAFHAVADLPETLVTGHARDYFDFFFNRLAGPRGVPGADRERYAAAYASRAALRAGFDWYRAFAQDEKDNHTDFWKPVSIPTLYLRGDHESGTMDDYVAGFRQVGLLRLESQIIPECGHFSPSEQPERVAAALLRFAEAPSP